MPERTFFTLRYALPGYTFVLAALLVAYPKLEPLILNNATPIDLTLISAFLAFFTLLSGGAIGFIVSQVWYNLFHFGVRRHSMREARELLEEKYNLTKDTHHQIVFLDHVLHLSSKETITYMQRRFDLKHTLGSTLSATLIGSLFGLLVRANWFRTDITLEDVINSLPAACAPLHVLGLTTYDFGAIIIVTILSIFLIMSYRYINKEHAMMAYVLVQKVVKSELFPNSKAKAHFPSEYFIKKENEHEVK
jgi:hypothetical protein